MYNFTKLNQEKIENLKKPITSKEIETVIRNLPANKYTYICHVQINSFAPSFLIFVSFISFTCLFIHARTSSTVLNNSGESRPLNLIPDFRLKHLLFLIVFAIFAIFPINLQY